MGTILIKMNLMTSLSTPSLQVKREMAKGSPGKLSTWSPAEEEEQAGRLGKAGQWEREKTGRIWCQRRGRCFMGKEEVPTLSAAERPNKKTDNRPMDFVRWRLLLTLTRTV